MNVTQLPTARRRAPYGQQPAVSFDASRPAPHNDALKAAWNDGFWCGERAAYVSGWRWGFLTGVATASLLFGVVLGAVLNGWPV